MLNVVTDTTVNGQEILKEETTVKSRWCRYLCETDVNDKTRRHWTSDLPKYIEDCNANGWEIQKVTWFVAKVNKETPANYGLYNKR